MAKASALTIVQQKDLGVGFTFNSTTKKFAIAPVSSDASNVLTAGADGLAALTPGSVQSNQVTYTFALDTSSASNPKLTLYKTIPANGSTAAATSMVSAVPTSSFDATVTGGSFNSTSGVLTLTESNTGGTITINLGAYLTAVATANSNSIAHSGNGQAGSPLTASLTIDTITGNLLKVTASGTKVDPADVLALLNAQTTTLATGYDMTNGYFQQTVKVAGQAAVTANTNIVQLLGVDGTTIGYALTGA